jgi:ribonuclease HI
MLLTLFCDASYHAGAAGWGAWAKRHDWPSGIVFGGAFKAETGIANCGEAELCAIANGLFYLRRHGHLDGITKIMVQSDSAHALGMMLSRIPNCQHAEHKESGNLSTPKKLRKLSEVCTKGLDVIFALTAGTELCVRHVRAHKKGEGRSWVNRQCDRIARKHRKLAEKAKSV